MSDDAAARHLLDDPYSIAVLAELGEGTAREMVGVYKGMVAELSAAGYRKAIKGTFLADDGRQLIGSRRWRAIAEHPVIPTRPARRDTLYYRLRDDGMERAIEGLRFAGSVFGGSPLIGDLYAIARPRRLAPPQKPNRKPGRPAYSYWGPIEHKTLVRVVKEKINPDEPGALARVEATMFHLLMDALPDKAKTPAESTIRRHAKNVLDKLARRRVRPS
jgi:hypothetical protein